LQSCSAHDDHVIEAVAPNRSDEALNVGVLPRRARRRSSRLRIHPGHGVRHICKDRIAIVEEISRGQIVRERLAELLGSPRGGVRGDRDVHDASPIVCQDDRHKQEPMRDRRDDEDTGRYLQRSTQHAGSPRSFERRDRPTRVGAGVSARR
jgi:hypothetical protein